jgi:micrococcal nuclease
LSEPETGTVDAVVDGETLRLTDGRIVRMIGAKAPMPPLGWRGDNPWPWVEEAKTALERLALAQPVVVAGGERLWLQEAMIAGGLARVYSFPDNRACAPELLAREQETRSKRLGLWGSSAYHVVKAVDLSAWTA